jgi:hypothetical protein
MAYTSHIHAAQSFSISIGYSFQSLRNASTTFQASFIALANILSSSGNNSDFSENKTSIHITIAQSLARLSITLAKFLRLILIS